VLAYILFTLLRILLLLYLL